MKYIGYKVTAVTKDLQKKVPTMQLNKRFVVKTIKCALNFIKSPPV